VFLKKLPYSSELAHTSFSDLINSGKNSPLKNYKISGFLAKKLEVPILPKGHAICGSNSMRLHSFTSEKKISSKIFHFINFLEYQKKFKLFFKKIFDWANLDLPCFGQNSFWQKISSLLGLSAMGTVL
jgi:hypothetical protein